MRYYEQRTILKQENKVLKRRDKADQIPGEPEKSLHFFKPSVAANARP